MEKTVDIVIPVFNEEEAITNFHALLCSVIDALPDTFSIIYINDGSRDLTQEKLAKITEKDSRVSVIELSRNFGHQNALTAGLDNAKGDIVITMDGDGEHPPEMIPEMLELSKTYDLVLTQRMEQEKLSWFKRWTSTIFYKLINRIGDTAVLHGGADFRLMTRSAVNAIRSMPEYHRFLRGMVSWIGFRSVILPYQPADRLGGQSKYSLRKMVRLSLDAVFSFSLLPLYTSVSLGALFLLAALVEAIYVLSFWISGNTETLAPGWSSLMFVLLVVGGTIMIILGFIGIYIGYIFQEVKRRPSYLVRDILSSKRSSTGNPSERLDA